jgi:hypothetical protein
VADSLVKSSPLSSLSLKLREMSVSLLSFGTWCIDLSYQWVASLWIPPVPISETTQVKDGSKQASVAPPQGGDSSSTTPNVVSGSVEEQNPLSDTGASGNTEDPSVLLPVAPDSVGQSAPTSDLDDKHAIKAEESKDEVPLVQEPDLGQTEPTADIHEVFYRPLFFFLAIFI